MSTSVDKANRTALVVVGILAASVGIYGLARGFGAVGSGAADGPLLTVDVRDLVTRNGDWLWPAAAMASLALAFLGARWLLAQVSTPAIGDMALAEDSGGGTRLRAAGAAAALATDIESYPGVRSAAARIVTDDARPSLDVQASLDPDADPVDVRRRIEEHALPRLSQALQREVDARSIRLRLS